MQNILEKSPGLARRRDDWDELTKISTIGRSTLETVPNYRLYKAATRAEASPPARLLLVHLIGYLGIDQIDDPKTRFVVFPGNTRLADELHYSKRTIQRLSDELEEAGLLRRCYNGLNRRIGFDLTPLAMRHEVIEASIVALQSQRRAERDALQLELGLSADRIQRPVFATSLPAQNVAPSMSSRDDKSDTQIRPTNQDSAEVELFTILDGVDQRQIENVFAVQIAEQDRTKNSHADEVAILRKLTGSGRASHIGWALAKKTYGIQRAAALCTIAFEDPKRRASPDRYFGWLLRMAMTADGHSIIGAAAKRIKDKKDRTVGAAPVEANFQPIAGESEAATAIRERLFNAVGSRSYQTWIEKASLAVEDGKITVQGPSMFLVRYLEDHYGMIIAQAGRAALKEEVGVAYRVA